MTTAVHPPTPLLVSDRYLQENAADLTGRLLPLEAATLGQTSRGTASLHSVRHLRLRSLCSAQASPERGASGPPESLPLA